LKRKLIVSETLEKREILVLAVARSISRCPHQVGRKHGY
jgi:hypothetical protein